MATGKKGAQRLDAHIVFVDESGFQLTPSVRRTWAPRGQTPLVCHWQRRDKVSAISALSVSPKRAHIGLYWQLRQTNIRQAEACGFLRHLLRHLRGHVIVIWDNSKVHKGEVVRQFCGRFSRLHLERFPAYAPELNPDEEVWDHLKGALANGCPDDLAELLADLGVALADLRQCQPALRSCIHRSELPLQLA